MKNGLSHWYLLYWSDIVLQKITMSHCWHHFWHNSIFLLPFQWQDMVKFPDFQMTAIFAKLVFILDFYWPKKFSVSWIQSWRDAFFFFLWNWRFDKFGSWASKAFFSCGRIIGKNLCSCTVHECPENSNWYDFLLIVDLKFVPPFQRKTKQWYKKRPKLEKIVWNI